MHGVTTIKRLDNTLLLPGSWTGGNLMCSFLISTRLIRPIEVPADLLQRLIVLVPSLLVIVTMTVRSSVSRGAFSAVCRYKHACTLCSAAHREIECPSGSAASDSPIYSGSNGPVWVNKKRRL